MIVEVPYRAAVCRTRLTRLHQDFLCDLLGRGPSESVRQLRNHEILLFFLGRILNEGRRMNDDTWQVLMRAVAADVSGYAQRVVDSIVFDNWQMSEVMTISILDGRHLTWTGFGQFVSLITGKTVPTLPRPALEIVSINLLALFVRSHKFCTDATEHAERMGEKRQRA